MDPEDKIYVELGHIVKQARLQSGLSQEELALGIGLTRTSVTNLERGRQRIQVHTLIRIANALGVSPSSLLPSIGGPAIERVEQRLREFKEEERDWVAGMIASTER